MALIRNDVAVLIAEHVDMDSMAPFMLSSKAHSQLIRGYERSIVKAKIAQTVYDPMLRPPLDAVLSSSALDQPGLDRKVLEPASFAVAKELELRKRRIDSLFSSGSTNPRGQPFMEAINRLALFQNLPPNETERLIDGLKDACMVADRIADCAASVHLDSDCRPAISTRKWVIEQQVHLARQRYIRSLAPTRLAFLTLLASLTGMTYHTQNPQSPGSDPFQWERVTAFKETFLRHGTVVISALLLRPSESKTTDTSSSSARTSNGVDACHSSHARNSESARYYCASQVDAVLMELLEYEGQGHWGSLRPAEHGITGNARPNVPDSLHMTMLQAFRGPDSETAEEVVQPQAAEDVVGDKDADGAGLFDVGVVDHGDDDVEVDPSLRTSVKPDPRDALILRWVK